MNKSVKDNLIFILVAHACFFAEPLLVHAENANYDPQNFTQPLSVARGTIMPAGSDALYLVPEQRCDFVVKEFGWAKEGCDSIEQLIFFLTPDIDNVMFNKPATDGYVSLDDWEGGNLSEEIASIEASYREQVKAQSERMGQPISFEGWLVFPQVDRTKNILYYANILNWNGNRTINISISKFDRRGYIPIKVVPSDSNVQSGSVENIVAAATAAYVPKAGDSYAEFTSGDPVAGYGAVGVLAAMLGVKYGKAASAGLIAVALLFLKKAWFLLVLPLYWLKNLFRRKPNA